MLQAASTLLIPAADSINPASLPAGLPVYMGYGNGAWPDYEAIARAHPGATVIDLSVYLANLGQGGDFEPGDMTPAQAPTYVRWRLAAGVWRPIAYGSIGDQKAGLPAVVAELEAAGLQWPRDYRRLSAHYGAGEHICGPGTCGSPIQCDGTQWENTPGYDLSILAEDFLGPIAAPGAPPAGASSVVGLAVTADGGGYWLAEAGGHVHNLGDAAGAEPISSALAQPVVGIAGRPGGGYWLAAADGGVFPGDGAPFLGSLGGAHLAKPVVGIAGDPAAPGFWLTAADGGVFGFSAPFHGSAGGAPLAQPVVGMAATPDGGGYWLAARDGGVFSYGDARFHGSLGGIKLAAPIVGVAARPQGDGYWLAGSDGGVFCFGGAGFHGSTGGLRLAAPVVGIAATRSGGGYYLVAEDGGVFCFGDAVFHGSGA